MLTITPFIPFDFWWLRMFDFPHVQLTILTLFAILLFTYKFDLNNKTDCIFITLLISCCLYQFAKIYPYTKLAPYKILSSTEKPLDSIKVLTANVLQKNNKYHLLINEIEELQPDVLLLTEVDKKWISKLDGITNKIYNYSVEYPLDNAYGIALYSKLPLIKSKVKFLVADTIPSIHSKLLLKSGDTIQLFAIHPTPPILEENRTSTDRDAEMMMIAKMSMEEKLPVIVCGDFNDVAWSQTSRIFERVSQLLDARIGRGMFNTYSAKSYIMRWPLDHVFVSSEFRIKNIEVRESINSDHYPLYTRFTYEPEIKSQQKPPTVKEEDLNFANDQIEHFLKEKRKKSN